MPRRHLKKDDRTTLCGLTIIAKFQKHLAPDRQSVTCGFCEVTSRPKIAPPPPKVEEFASIVPDVGGFGGEDGPRDHREHREHRDIPPPPPPPIG